MPAFLVQRVEKGEAQIFAVLLADSIEEVKRRLLEILPAAKEILIENPDGSLRDRFDGEYSIREVPLF